MKALFRCMKTFLVVVPIVVAASLSGCGGGGGGGATPNVTPTTVTGTVATGKPLGNAQITLTDSNGLSNTATSTATGSYTIDVTGLTAPFVVKATGLQGALSVTLVSLNNSIVISSANTINLTQLTTAIAAILSSTGFAKDLDAVNDKAKIMASLFTVDSYIKTLIAPTLTAAGLSTTTDPITTPFVADGTGYDSFYDNLLIGQASNGTIFMAPKRPSSPCPFNLGGCWTASDPGDQTITNPNLCGFDIATGAGIPCDPSLPITATPSVALPIAIAGGFAISGQGVQLGSLGSISTVITTSSPFTGTTTVSRVVSSGASCSWSVAFSGTITSTITLNGNGTYTGTAALSSTASGTVTSGTCTSSTQSFNLAIPLSGTYPNISWSSSVTSAGGSVVGIGFSGSISGGTITGTVTVG